jgi:hypothetical protein
MGFGHAFVTVVGGVLSHNGMVATVVSAFDATLSLMNVVIDQNPGTGVATEVTTLTMRRCTVTGNFRGVDVDVMESEVTDLGSASSPGENIFQNNSNAGLHIQGSDFGALRTIQAIGNIWNPRVQDADNDGKYDSRLTIPGPSTAIVGPNYDLFGRMTNLQL